jgi:hypothetical protein
LAAVATDQLVSDRRDDEGLIAEVNIVFCQRPTADELRKPALGEQLWSQTHGRAAQLPDARFQLIPSDIRPPSSRRLLPPRQLRRAARRPCGTAPSP